MRIELPFPPSGLSPNRKNGGHWGVTHRIKEKYKQDCWALTREAMNQGDDAEKMVFGSHAIPITLTYCQPDKRRRDADNLLAASKAGLDGVADALKVDDILFEPVIISRTFGTKPGMLVVEIGL